MILSLIIDNPHDETVGEYRAVHHLSISPLWPEEYVGKLDNSFKISFISAIIAIVTTITIITMAVPVVVYCYCPSQAAPSSSATSPP